MSAPPTRITVDSETFVRAIAGAAMGEGLLPDQSPDFEKLRGDKRMIVVAAAPRSGSTFLSNVLTQLTGFPYCRLCSGYSTNEHDLYLPALCLMNATGCVSQLHMKGTHHNAALLRSFAIKPIILVRRLHDMLLSLRHDLRRKEQLAGYATGVTGYSFVWLDQCTRGLNDEALLDLIVDLAVPWYINFYVSWHRLCEQNLVDALWVTYEQMMENKQTTVEQILDFVEASNICNDTQSVLNRPYATFNDGRVGRGESALSTDQKARIRRLLEYYPDIDFGRYGFSVERKSAQ